MAFPTTDGIHIVWRLPELLGIVKRNGRLHQQGPNHFQAYRPARANNDLIGR
jgi:hypothetical protein